jgi:PPOX class probable F420-dependent enzyme
MDLTNALTWAAARRDGVLITLRADGRAQSSDISYTVVDGAFVISVTDDRAKTRNMRRDPRVVLHLTDPASWSYVSFDGTASLTPVATAPDDATCDALVAYYRGVRGAEHPDWDDYRRAMVADRRLVVRVVPTSAVGQVRGI